MRRRRDSGIGYQTRIEAAHSPPTIRPYSRVKRGKDAEGIQRLRYRHSREKPTPLTPGQIEEITVDCWSTSQIFNIGHRVRVTITSSNYPRFDVNPGTGQPWSDSGEKVKQSNRIYCDAEHPSRLVVPVVE